MSAFIDETLNMSGPGRGDAHDEFNTQMRETARFQAMQSLDAIARMFRNPPARGWCRAAVTLAGCGNGHSRRFGFVRFRGVADMNSWGKVAMGQKITSASTSVLNFSDWNKWAILYRPTFGDGSSLRGLDRFSPHSGRLSMDQFVLAQNIMRYKNLLETSVNETERQTIQNLLDEEEAKQALHASAKLK
jgi:hypothetical protein